MAAKANEGGSATLQSLLRFGLPMAVGAAVLLLGYLLGIRSFKSIWVVSVISTSSVLVCEPVFAYFVFRTLQQKGALMGMVLGIVGSLATFWE